MGELPNWPENVHVLGRLSGEWYGWQERLGGTGAGSGNEYLPAYTLQFERHQSILLHTAEKTGKI